MNKKKDEKKLTIDHAEKKIYLQKLSLHESKTSLLWRSH